MPCGQHHAMLLHLIGAEQIRAQHGFVNLCRAKDGRAQQSTTQLRPMGFGVKSPEFQDERRQ